MRDLKADHWFRIGRFRRTKWPGIGRQGTNLRFLYGRLVCDLASDGAKSTMWKSRTDDGRLWAKVPKELVPGTSLV
ncbi:hypothetical protein BGY98DRAFT_944374 [Russula aff. rugulosa BPL654]|nr:hypothetical protein BGY98DRAFT_944374 [Russula aff. rugulosa BPL654]